MYKDILLKITKSLYPLGRAFWIPIKSILEKIHVALIYSENDAIVASDEILNSILPDNDNFTINDAPLWELRLGIAVNTSLTLTERKEAILNICIPS